MLLRAKNLKYSDTDIVFTTENFDFDRVDSLFKKIVTINNKYVYEDYKKGSFKLDFFYCTQSQFEKDIKVFRKDYSNYKYEDIQDYTFQSVYLDYDKKEARQREVWFPGDGQKQKMMMGYRYSEPTLLKKQEIIC